MECEVMAMKKFSLLLAVLVFIQMFPVIAAEPENLLLFFDNFETQDETRWESETEDGSFVLEEGEHQYVYSVGSTDFFEKNAMANLRNYAFSFDLKMDYRDANGAFGNTWPTLRFRVRDGAYYHMYLYNKQGSEEIGVQKFIGEEEFWLGTASVPLTKDNEAWVAVRIELTGNLVNIYYKDIEKPVISFADTEGETPGGGSFCFIKNGVTAFYVDNLMVEQTLPQHEETEWITKKTDREIIHFYDYESQPEAETVVEEENGNHYIDAAGGIGADGELQDFITRFNWIRDYKPYGTENPVFSFSDGYEIELDSSVFHSAAVLKKDGAELSEAPVWFADDDAVWTAVGFAAIGSEILFYYGDMTEPVLQFDTGETLPPGEITITGGGVDNWYLASAFRQKPVEILSMDTEIVENMVNLNVCALSHLEEDVTASAVAAVYQDGNMCAFAALPVTIIGNELNGTEKQETNLVVSLPETEGARYAFYLWDGMKPLADAAVSGEEPERRPMPPDDGTAPKLSLSAECNDGGVRVTGKLMEDTEQSVTVLVQAFDPAAENSTPQIAQAVYVSQLARPGADGAFQLDFTLDKTLPEGDYRVYAASDDAQPVWSDIEYIKQENLDSFLETVNLAQTAQDIRKLLLDSANSRYAKHFGLDVELFAALGEETLQNGVCSRMLAEKNDGFTAENISGKFMPHLAFALLKTAEGGDEIRELMTENPALYTLSPETEEIYSKAEEKVQIETLNGLYKGLKENRYDSLEETMADFLPNVILASIYCANYKDIPEILNQYEQTLGIRLSMLNELEPSEKTAVYQALNQERYYSFEAFGNAFSAAVENAKAEAVPTRRPGGGSGGGSSGGSGGSSTITVQPTPAPSASAQPQPTQEPQNVSCYPDVPSDHWAYDAVKTLAGANPPIVSGYEDGLFHPDRHVTRAEFVKLIIHAFHFKLPETGCTYADVSADAWYAPYVAAAQQAGFVQGTDQNLFEPEKEITRQDMAVMLFRVLEIKLISLPLGTETVLKDADTISDYAKAAVENLSGAGVINGTEGGNFEPLSPASRAQAVKMIYEMIK